MRIGTDGFPLTRYQLVNCEESAFQTKIILKYGKRDDCHYQSPVDNHQSEFTHPRVCTHKLGRNYVSCTIWCARLNVRENSTELLSNRRGVEQDGGLKTKIFSIRYHCYKTFRCKVLRAYLEWDSLWCLFWRGRVRCWRPTCVICKEGHKARVLLDIRLKSNCGQRKRAVDRQSAYCAKKKWICPRGDSTSIKSRKITRQLEQR